MDNYNGKSTAEKIAELKNELDSAREEERYQKKQKRKKIWGKIKRILPVTLIIVGVIFFVLGSVLCAIDPYDHILRNVLITMVGVGCLVGGIALAIVREYY